MASAVMVRINLALVGIRYRRRRTLRLRKSHRVRKMKRQVAKEMVVRNRKTLQDFRKIDAFPKGKLFTSFHVFRPPKKLAGKRANLLASN
jgi:hypothetical protein